MKLWIDDIRNPERFLGKEKAEGIVWKKEAWSARNYLFKEVNEDIDTLYLDNFLGDRQITGESMLETLAFRLRKFPKLKKIYLHSSDDRVVDRCIEKYKEKLAEHGIELIDAEYREHD